MTGMINMPDIELIDVPLEAREVLGGEATADQLVEANRVSFGRTEPLLLTPTTAGIDGSLSEYLAADSQHRYAALSFTCSFRPGDEPIVEARLAMRLRSGSPDTVAWSLYPERLAREVKRTRSLSLGPKATFALEVGLEIGAELSRSEEFTAEDCYVIATGRGESTVQWYFRQTTAVALEGMHDLRLIVRSRADLPVEADLKMTAKIRRRFAGIIPYRAALPESLRTVRIPT